jgi:hypothetical protein
MERLKTFFVVVLFAAGAVGAMPAWGQTVSQKFKNVEAQKLTAGGTNKNLQIGQPGDIITFKGDAMNFEGAGHNSTFPTVNGRTIMPFYIVSTTNSYSASSNSSATFIDYPGMTLSITPHDANSRIKLDAFFNIYNVPTTSGACLYRVTRNGTTIFSNDATALSQQVDNFITFSFVDSPATTSAVQYKVQYASSTGTNTCWRGLGSGAGTQNVSMTLFEIGAP